MCKERHARQEKLDQSQQKYSISTSWQPDSCHLITIWLIKKVIRVIIRWSSFIWSHFFIYEIEIRTLVRMSKFLPFIHDGFSSSIRGWLARMGHHWPSCPFRTSAVEYLPDLVGSTKSIFQTVQLWHHSRDVGVLTPKGGWWWVFEGKNMWNRYYLSTLHVWPRVSISHHTQPGARLSLISGGSVGRRVKQLTVIFAFGPMLPATPHPPPSSFPPILWQFVIRIRFNGHSMPCAWPDAATVIAIW